MIGRNLRAVAACALVCSFVVPSSAMAQDITYQPIDPSFGGNPFNSAHLLGIANAQNDYKDPKATANSSQADIFARQLQSRLLSALSSQIVDASDIDQSGTGNTATVSQYSDDNLSTVTQSGTGNTATVTQGTP